MAEAVIELVLENLNSLVQKELGVFLGFNDDLKRLSSTLTAIKATLEDAEEKQFTDRAIKDWLQKLKDAAHVLDDILDECATEALEMENRGFMCGLSGKLKKEVKELTLHNLKLRTCSKWQEIICLQLKWGLWFINIERYQICGVLTVRSVRSFDGHSSSSALTLTRIL